MTAQNSQHRHIHRAQQDTPHDPSEYTLHTVMRPNAKPWQTFISVEDHNLLTEVDTGAAVTVICESTYNRICVILVLIPTQSG